MVHSSLPCADDVDLPAPGHPRPVVSYTTAIFCRSTSRATFARSAISVNSSARTAFFRGALHSMMAVAGHDELASVSASNPAYRVEHRGAARFRRKSPPLSRSTLPFTMLRVFIQLMVGLCD